MREPLPLQPRVHRVHARFFFERGSPIAARPSRGLCRRSGSMAAAGGDGPPDEQHVVAVSLGADELRLVFAQLLTTRDCEKDFGRCASVALRLCGSAACGFAPCCGFCAVRPKPRAHKRTLGKRLLAAC